MTIGIYYKEAQENVGCGMLEVGLREKIENSLRDFKIDILSNFNGNGDFGSCDLIVSVGGDGTFINAFRDAYKYDIPIMGINAGNLGFLTECNLQDFEEKFEMLVNNQYEIQESIVFKAMLYKGNSTKEVVLINDIVFLRPDVSSMSKLDVFIDDKMINSYYGDGLIVSTPLGSTAYNLSSGGSIAHPSLKIMLLTPVCPHSLTQRPLILPSNQELKIKNKNNTALVIDGKSVYDMDLFDYVVVKESSRSLKCIRFGDYFERLKSKMKFGG